jgi:general secretion pathway protein H
MTSSPTELTGRKAELERQVTSPAGPADAGEQGFTLLEIVCVLAIVAMLAAIALPAMPRGTTLPNIEGYALETAALLNADHNAAQRQKRAAADDPIGRQRRGAAISV